MRWRGQANKDWSDQFIPRIKEIIGRTLIATSPCDEDMQRNADLIVLTLGSVRIGCRVRRASYFDKYRDEFTIRCGVPTERKTEITKIVEGWGDYFFYGFAGDAAGEIRAYGIGDLKVFRLWFMRQITANSGRQPGIVQKNGDGTWFRAFRWDDLPPEFCIARECLEQTEVIPLRPSEATREELSDLEYFLQHGSSL